MQRNPSSASVNQPLCARVLWAPVLFSPRNDFPGIRDNPITVSTGETIKLFDSIQVNKLVQVHYNIPRSLYQGDTIQTKTNILINGNGNIHEGNWNKY